MKKQANLFTQLNNQQFDILSNVVKETIAAGFNQPISRIFTAAELWNIQNQAKRRVQSRMMC